jgi:CRP-like cAMP-binding protein
MPWVLVIDAGARADRDEEMRATDPLTRKEVPMPRKRSVGSAHARPRNQILVALPAEEQERLRPHLTRVYLERKEVLIEPNRPIESVYFPEDAMVSVLSLMADGSAVEVATIGREGVVGLPVFLGSGSMAGQVVTQVAGMALRISAGAFREEAVHCGTLMLILSRYTQALVTLLGQSSGCNRVHLIHQRCARWLLMVQDRVGRDSFSLTHLFLSQMLGVRRASVTDALGDLQKEGLIAYSRGRISILDRAGLEAASCECYAIIQSEFARLLEGREIPSPLDRMRTSAHGRTLAGDGASEVGKTADS